ncbi:MAG: CHAT domain-containing protein [Thermodesulfobacteriota bacterium]
MSRIFLPPGPAAGFWLWLAGCFLVPGPVWAEGSTAAAVLAAAQAPLLARADEACRRGAFAEAIALLAPALRDQTDREPREQVQLALRLAQAYRALGRPEAGLACLEVGQPPGAALTAPLAAGSTGDRRAAALLAQTRGSLKLAAGRPAEARPLLEEAARLAGEMANDSLAAAIANDLGLCAEAEERLPEALAAFQAAAAQAAKADDRLPGATALANAGRLAHRLGRPEQALLLARQAVDLFQDQPASHDAVSVRLHLGLLCQELAPVLPAAQRLAADLFAEAGRQAESLDDLRLASYAFGYAGGLYEKEGRLAAALDLTRRAAFQAQAAQAPELLFRWHWQTGRLLRAQGQPDEALASLRRAARSFALVRTDLVASCRGDLTRYHRTACPLFFSLVDLLLDQAAHRAAGAGRQALLLEARDAMEEIKKVELENYFQDACLTAVAGQATAIDRMLEGAAALYPVLLPDRAELLVSFADRLERYPVPLATGALTAQVHAWRQKLEKRTTSEHLPLAQALYDALIRPLEPDLAQAGVRTLVVVPDGVLRTVPLSALHDGERYLVERFAVAVAPSLALTAPRPWTNQGRPVLVAGLAEAVQGFPALPFAGQELAHLHGLLAGSTLLQDQAFVTPALEATLQAEPFSMVHIASHGQFGSRLADTFLLAYDGKITMDRLAGMVGLFRFRQEPLELLTLSACQTAAGDERAALGLAGIAIKAGARSALATLWLINDQAASQLVTELYRQLQRPGMSRAAALQAAQKSLLADRRFRHPAYWAPFLLLNNWL